MAEIEDMHMHIIDEVRGCLSMHTTGMHMHVVCCTRYSGQGPMMHIQTSIQNNNHLVNSWLHLIKYSKKNCKNIRGTITQPSCDGDDSTTTCLWHFMPTTAASSVACAGKPKGLCQCPGFIKHRMKYVTIYALSIIEHTSCSMGNAIHCT
jgi:hypothetical protein